MTQTLAKKVRPVCNHCGSGDIRIEAYIAWDFTKQNWKISELIDSNQVCNECGKDCKPKWVLV